MMQAIQIKHRDMPINEVMQLTAMRFAVTIETLKERGFTVAGIEFSEHSIPTVQVQVCPECAKLIASGEAVYYCFSGNDGTPYRKGQFRVGDIRVIWVERGH